MGTESWDALRAALPARGNRADGPSAPRAGLSRNHLQRALEAAVTKGDVQRVRESLVAGADPHALAPHSAGIDKCDVQTLLSAARLLRRVLPACDAARPETPLLQALRDFDLPLARQLYDQKTRGRALKSVWRHGIEAPRTDLLIAALVLHADENVEYKLKKMSSRGSLNGQLHRPLQMAGAPELTAYLKQFPYYSEKPSRQSDANFNGKAAFALQEEGGDEKILCRHLAVAWLMQHELPTGKPDYQALGSVQAIVDHVPSSVDALYRLVMDQSDDVHIVRHTDWGNFAVERFRGLERSGAPAARMLIMSGNHCMAAEFKVKRNDGSAPRYVLKVYDPNVTAAHKRFGSDDLTRAREGELKDFLYADEAFALYFGEAENVFLTAGVPAGGVASLLETPVGEVVDRRVSGELPPLDGFIMCNLMAMGFAGTLRDQKDYLVQLAEASPAAAYELLKAAPANQLPALKLAIGYGKADSVLAYCELVKASPLSQKQKAELLECSFEDEVPVPILASAMCNESVAVCRALIDGIVRSGLDAPTLSKLLAACTGDLPALSAAIATRGRPEVVQLFVEGLSRSDLPASVQVELLTARFRGDTALSTALESGEADAVRALMQGVAKSGSLDEQDKFQLFAARDDDGIPGLLKAMTGGQPTCVTAFVEGIANSGLPPEMQLELLLARHPDGTPALSRSASMDQRDAVRAFVDSVGASDLPHSIKAEIVEPESRSYPGAASAGGGVGRADRATIRRQM